MHLLKKLGIRKKEGKGVTIKDCSTLYRLNEDFFDGVYAAPETGTHDVSTLKKMMSKSKRDDVVAWFKEAVEKFPDHDWKGLSRQ